MGSGKGLSLCILLGGSSSSSIYQEYLILEITGEGEAPVLYQWNCRKEKRGGNHSIVVAELCRRHQVGKQNDMPSSTSLYVRIIVPQAIWEMALHLNRATPFLSTLKCLFFGVYGRPPMAVHYYVVVTRCISTGCASGSVIHGAGYTEER